MRPGLGGTNNGAIIAKRFAKILGQGYKDVAATESPRGKQASEDNLLVGTDDDVTDRQRGTAITLQSRAAGGFRDPTRLTRWLKILLWAQIGLGTVAVISDLLELKLLADLQAVLAGILTPGRVADEFARYRRASDTSIAIVRLIFPVTAIIFLMWIHRANYNARRLGAAGMTYTPGWAVGCFFIPIASLWMPYEAMVEIWKASANPVHWQDQERGDILPWW
jgi:hypothetical protein